MNNPIKSPTKLKQERDSLNSKDNLAFIKFYEDNLTSIECIESETNKDLYFFKLHLIAEYGMSLASTGYTKKALPYLENAIELFEKAYQNKQNELIAISFYQHLLWNYGITLRDTKELKLSTSVFERLVKYYPQNDMYNEWLFNLKKNRFNQFINPTWYVAGIWLIGEFTFFDNFSKSTQFTLTMIGGGLVLFLLLIRVIVYFKLKKYKP